MKIFLIALLSFLVLTSEISFGYAAEKAKTAPRIELLDDATMDKLLKQGIPAKQHELLSSLGGAWNFDLKYWSAKDAEPQLSTGWVENEMVLGGRFLSSKANVILNIGGENIPYEGWLFLGYDTIKKTYTSFLIDTMHTGMTDGTGKYDEKTKTLEEKGRFTHPLLDKERAYRSELQFTDSDSYKQTIFITDSAGKEFKVLEMDFRRKG